MVDDNKCILNQYKKKMQVIDFEKFEDIIYWPQKIEK